MRKNQKIKSILEYLQADVPTGPREVGLHEGEPELPDEEDEEDPLDITKPPRIRGRKGGLL